MRNTNGKRQGMARRGMSGRRAMLVPISAMTLTSSALATNLFFDLNNTTGGFGNGTGIWDTSTTSDWSTSSAGTAAPGTWLQTGQTAGTNDFNIANFSAALTANVSGTVDISALNFNSGNSTIGFTFDTNNNATGTLNFGSNNLPITIASGTDQLWAPLSGSGNIVYTYNGSVTFDLASDLTNFTGNIYINNGTTNRATQSSLQMNTVPGNPNATMYVDANVKFANNNQVTLSNGTKTSLDITLPNPIVLNYGGASSTPLNNASELIYSSNGIDSGTFNSSVMNLTGGNVTGITPGQAMIETFTGNISSPSGVTTNVVIGSSNTAAGGRGVVVLSGHNTWTGYTLITTAGNTASVGTSSANAGGNGLVQMGADNALPTGTNLIFGVSAALIAPFDLNGYNLQVGALTTGTTTNVSNTNGVTNGNIYNLSPAGQGANSVTITIAGSTPSVYKGDIGCTNLNVHPFDNQTPFLTSNGGGGYNWAIQANTNISMQLNGPGTVVLAPVSGEAAGNEYTGTTTVSGGTLVFGRTDTYASGPGIGLPAGKNTLTGGGDVTVSSGAVLSSIASNSTTYVGGTAGNIILNSGSQLNPGQAVVSGTITATNPSYTVALSPNNIGTLDTTNIQFNSGASMNFSIASTSSYDYLVLNGSLTLDTSAGGHTINVNLPTGKSLNPGTYTLIKGFGSINGDGTNGNGTSTGFVIGTTPVGYGDFTYKLFDVGNEVLGNSLQLQIIAPVLQWDPNGTGLATSTGTITENGGEWTDGTGSDGNPATTFYDYSQSKDIAWVNGANQQVYIGNDANQNGGTITLGSNISLQGVLVFGAIAPVNNYKIVNGSTTYTLTLGGGISVINSAATTTGGPSGTGTPSAEIDTPIVLSADQNWDVPSGQFLDIKGTVTGSFALTQLDSGVIDIENGGGSIGSLNLLNGTMLFGSGTAVGAAPITINGGVLEVTANATLTNTLTFGTSGGSIGAAQSSSGPAVALTLPTISTANPVTIIGTGTVNLAASNTFSGGLTIAGGTVPVSAVAQLGASTSLTLSGGTLALTGIPTLTNNLNTGTSPTAVGIISDTVPLTFNVTGTGSGVLGLSGSQFTINVPSAATTGAIGAVVAGTTIHKTGAGTLTVGGFTGTAVNAASTIYIDTGNIAVTTYTSLGGTDAGTSVASNIVIAGGATLTADWSSNSTRLGGTVTFNGGATTATQATITRPYIAQTTNSETAFQANSAADVWTINGHTLIDDAAVLTQNVDEILGITNPVVVNTGAVLTLECDNTFGFGGNDAVDFRGPTATSNTYDDFVIHAGATVTQTGPGELRFGRVNTQGVAIIGQGTPGSESVVQLGLDCYMADNVTAANLANGEIDTTFLPVGSGNAGLRIEASMNATYEEVTTGGTNPATPEGTTGLLGVNTTSSRAGGSVPSGFSVIASAFTVMSPNRLMALSSTYNDGTNTFTPSGTLTLAANDAGNVTGLINGGPAAACAVTLALDNTSGSGGTHIYQIDPASPQGGSFANFAGLTVERTFASAAAVTAQLLGTTKVPALTISGGAKVDITTKALVVDPATGPAPTAAIAAYLQSAYDHGNWDAAGIDSSSVASVRGTSIGYAENDLLPVPYTTFGGQTVDNNAVLVKYTWMGDLNLDGVVDGNDLAMMGGSLGGSSTGWINGDLNYDGTVNADDYALFQLGAASQTGTLTSAVPEPAVGAMLTLAVAGLGARRRRR